MDLWAVGESLKRLLGLEAAAASAAEATAASSNEAMYVRLRWPELPLLEFTASEKRGALRGELISVRVGYGRSEALDDESDWPSMSKAAALVARLRRSSSSTLGSIVSRVRSSQPCLALNWASARRLWRCLAICIEEKGREALEEVLIRRYFQAVMAWIGFVTANALDGCRTYLADLCTLQHTVHHILRLLLPRRGHWHWMCVAQVKRGNRPCPFAARCPGSMVEIEAGVHS